LMGMQMRRQDMERAADDKQADRQFQMQMQGMGFDHQMRMLELQMAARGGRRGGGGRRAAAGAVTEPGAQDYANRAMETLNAGGNPYVMLRELREGETDPKEIAKIHEAGQIIRPAWIESHRGAGPPQGLAQPAQPVQPSPGPAYRTDPGNRFMATPRRD